MIENIKIYYAKMPIVTKYDIPISRSRKIYVHTFTNENAKAQRYWASVLLEKALGDFGVSFNNLTLNQTESGKWVCDRACFSISHSNGVVAVCVSNVNCGIDVEYFDKNRFSTKLLGKISSNAEQVLCDNPLPEDVITIWTQKESIYKLGVSEKTVANINVQNYLTKTFFLSVDGKGYCLSCASTLKNDVEFSTSILVEL